MDSLTGRRVLVTGASSGVGCAAAEAFAREGAAVALLARSRPGLEVVAERARAHGVAAHVVPADLADRTATEAAVAEAARALGGLDVLVVNAAGMVFGRFEEIEPEAFDRTVAITFLGAVNTVRAALPHLVRDGGGAIVATGSLMSRVPLPNFSPYTASKHALRGFLNTLRIELRAARAPVSVSMVHPGNVDTPLWGHISSVTGRLPRPIVDSYAPEEIARALVACARRPRRELTIGLETRVIELGYAFVRPVGDWALSLVARYHRTRRDPAPDPGLLWGQVGTGACRGDLHGRPSLWARLRLR